MIKECRKCGSIKDLSEFYVHKQMGDGHLNICKDCVRNRVTLRYEDKLNDPEFVKSEKFRHKHKYHRLYTGIKKDSSQKKREMKTYNSEYPEKYNAKIKSQRVPVAKGLQRHHWSYRDDDAKDIIPIENLDHAFLHTLITYDQTEMRYRVSDTGYLLDTRRKHEDFIASLADEFEKNRQDIACSKPRLQLTA